MSAAAGAERSGRASGYLPELDGLRAIAILLVMVYHLWDYRGAHWLGRIANQVFRQGWVGVDVFFALSGFLITRILLATKDSPRYYASFYIRRALRIFPLYYAALLLLTIVGMAAFARGASIGDVNAPQLGRIWLNYLYLSNFALAFLGSNAIPMDISWSLAVEEQYYLIYPFVVRRLTRHRLAFALVAAIVLAIPLRWLSFRVAPANHLGPYALPYCRMDALAVGGLAALAVERPESALTRAFSAAALPLWIAGAAFVLMWTRHQAPIVLVGYALVASATAATLVRLQTGKSRALLSVLRFRGLVAVGKVSYGLYLIHLFVRAAGERVGLVPGASRADLGNATLRVVVLVGVSLAVAYCSWLLLESPFLRLKDRLDQREPIGARRPEHTVRAQP